MNSTSAPFDIWNPPALPGPAFTSAYGLPPEPTDAAIARAEAIDEAREAYYASLEGVAEAIAAEEADSDAEWAAIVAELGVDW